MALNKSPKRPRDANQLAKMVVDLASGTATELSPASDSINEANRRGGLAGGKARADRLSPDRRSEIARQAANARYAKTPK